MLLHSKENVFILIDKLCEWVFWMSCLSVVQRLSWLCWMGAFICLYARFQGIKEVLMSQFYQSLNICSTQKCLKKIGLCTDVLFFVFSIINKSSVSDLQWHFVNNRGCSRSTPKVKPCSTVAVCLEITYNILVSHRTAKLIWIYISFNELIYSFGPRCIYWEMR